MTWEQLVKIEPGLSLLLKDIKRSTRGLLKSTFCANELWYRRYGYKHRMCELVGWEAIRPELRTMDAYDVAYGKLYGALPDCRHTDGLCR